MENPEHIRNNSIRRIAKVWRISAIWISGFVLVVWVVNNRGIPAHPLRAADDDITPVSGPFQMIYVQSDLRT